jgi:hypothetical protein
MKMTKALIMLAAGTAAAFALGIARADTITEKSGNSTATITQEPGTNMKRKVIKTPDGQTIIQQSGGNSASVKQSGHSGKADVSDCNKSKGKTAAKKKTDDDDDDCDF